MTRRTWLVPALVALNVALGVGLYLKVTDDPAAYAQARGRGGNYLTVAGHLNNNAIIYIMDANSGRLAAFRQETAAQRLSVASQGVDVIADMKRAFPAPTPPR